MFVLIANEKLIARALINTQRDGKPAPSIAEIAKAVSVNDDSSMFETYVLCWALNYLLASLEAGLSLDRPALSLVETYL